MSGFVQWVLPGTHVPHCPCNLSPISRTLRIEFPGANYHVTSRGDWREPIFEEYTDRAALDTRCSGGGHAAL